MNDFFSGVLIALFGYIAGYWLGHRKDATQECLAILYGFRESESYIPGGMNMRRVYFVKLRMSRGQVTGLAEPKVYSLSMAGARYERLREKTVGAPHWRVIKDDELHLVIMNRVCEIVSADSSELGLDEVSLM